MEFITNTSKPIQLYFFVILFACFINNISLSNAESVANPKIGYRSVVEKVDDNKKSCIPCSYLDNSLRSIKSLMNDFESLSNQHCSESNLSSQKSNVVLQTQEFKPEARSRHGYGRGHGHSRFDPPPFVPDNLYRRYKTSSTRRPPRPPGSYY